MKISKIEKKDGVYFVTKTPNSIQRFFGMKEIVEKYKHNGEVFLLFDHIKVFYKSTGEMLSWYNDVCKALNDYEHSF